MNPRVLFVGRGRLSLPLAPWLQQKWDALAEVLDLRVLNAGTGNGDARFRLLPDSAAAFYPRLPFEVARSLRTFPADVIVASDPYVGVAARTGRSLARSRARLIVEVHGDPRTFTRAYGSSARAARLDAGRRRRAIGDPPCRRDPRALRLHVVARRRGDAGTRQRRAFPTYSDLAAFRDPPLVPVPEARRVVFVGALEPYKNVDGLAAAWRRVAERCPDAVLTIVGRGSRREVIDRLVCRSPGPGRAPPRAAARRGRGADRLCAGARAPVVPGGPRARRARGVRARADGRRDERRRNPRHRDRRRRRDLDPASRHRRARRCARAGARGSGARRSSRCRGPRDVRAVGSDRRRLRACVPRLSSTRVIEARVKLVFVTQDARSRSPGPCADGRPGRSARRASRRARDRGARRRVGRRPGKRREFEPSTPTGSWVAAGRSSDR